jgi:hypothetical protein
MPDVTLQTTVAAGVLSDGTFFVFMRFFELWAGDYKSMGTDSLETGTGAAVRNNHRKWSLNGSQIVVTMTMMVAVPRVTNVVFTSVVSRLVTFF